LFLHYAAGCQSFTLFRAGILADLRDRDGLTLALIIHEHFCCNRWSAATTSLRSAGSSLGPSLSLKILNHRRAFPFAKTHYKGERPTWSAVCTSSGPHGSARWSRNAAQRFRDEPSW